MKISIVQGVKSIAKMFIAKKVVRFGHLGEASVVVEPFVTSNPSNISIGDHCNIGADSIIYATNAKVTIKKYFISARGLRISTGQHERRIGRFLASITEKEKNHSIGLDKDVTINEDVWAGFNVIITAGCEIGRGCTLAAGSVVTKSTPPYSLWGGAPARFIKFYWTIDEIMEHERILYPEKDRFSREQLEEFFKKFSKDNNPNK